MKRLRTVRLQKVRIADEDNVLVAKPMNRFVRYGTFGTTLTKETPERMTFDYPEIGKKYDPAMGTWHEAPFPKTPRGFSGGAIFGVAKPSGVIPQVEYKLLGIQYAWNEGQRVVFATPIKRLKELLVERGMVSP